MAAPRWLAWIRLRERQLSVLAGVLGLVVAALSAAVALYQAALLAGQQALPYQTAVYAAQIETGQELAVAAAAVVELVDERSAHCGAFLADRSPVADVTRNTEAIEQADLAFKAALVRAYFILPASMIDDVRAMEGEVGQIYGAAAGVACADLIAEDVDTDSFWRVYAAYMRAARAEARVDPLSETAVVRGMRNAPPAP